MYIEVYSFQSEGSAVLLNVVITEYATSLLSPTHLLTPHYTCMATQELERH